MIIILSKCIYLDFQGTACTSASGQYQTGESSSTQPLPPTGRCPRQQYTSVQGLLADHAEKVIDQSSEYILSIDRSTPERFRLGVTSFYKGAIAKPQKLKRSLVVNFVNTGELGSDPAALRKEFFEDALLEVNNQLFEGEDNRRVPKKDVSLEVLFEVAGMLLGHSIVQGGPGFRCLSPAVFEYLTSTAAIQPKMDIPLNICTHELITLIEEVWQ